MIPTPEVLMIRASLLVGASILDAGDRIAAWCGLDVSARWGMSPFAGHPADPVWGAVNVRMFLEHGQECSIPQVGEQHLREPLGGLHQGARVSALGVHPDDVGAEQ